MRFYENFLIIIIIAVVVGCGLCIDMFKRDVLISRSQNEEIEKKMLINILLLQLFRVECCIIFRKSNKFSCFEKKF